MKCPTCKEQSLVMSERQGVEIDYCPNCRGIWLDRGELDKILDKSKQPEAPYRSERSSHDSHPDYQQKPYKRRKSFLEELFD